MPRPKYPELTPGVERVSTSEMETYLRCGERPILEREAKRPRVTVPMLIGTGVSVAAHSDNTEKIKRGRTLPLADIVELAVLGYDQERGESEVVDSQLVQAEGRDDVAAAARAYGTRLSPFTREPIYAEDPIVAGVLEGIELAGTPDVIDLAGVVTDYKTGRLWSQEAVDNSRQLTNYGLLFYGRFKRFPKEFTIDNLYYAARAWHGARVRSRRTEWHYQSQLELIKRVVEAMKNGVALPPPEFGAWYCSKKHCGFFGSCKFTKGR